MQPSSKLDREPGRKLTTALSSGVLVLGLALAAPAFAAGDSGGSGGAGGGAGEEAAN